MAAYNLVKEPAPERYGALAEHAPASVAQAWYSDNRGTGRDLPGFYTRLLKAIREVDAHTR